MSNETSVLFEDKTKNIRPKIIPFKGQRSYENE